MKLTCLVWLEGMPFSEFVLVVHCFVFCTDSHPTSAYQVDKRHAVTNVVEALDIMRSAHDTQP